MRKLSSWKSLFVFMLVVFLFAGCGGGSDSGSSGSSSSPAPTNVNDGITPNSDINIPEGNNTYIDTYDIAEVMNGSWYGSSGSGTAVDTQGETYNIILSSMSVSIVATKITGNTGETYITDREYWNYEDSGYITEILLYSDAEHVNMRHIGTDTWRLIWSDGTVVKIMFTSEKAAIIEQSGTTEVDGSRYSYSVRGTINKIGSDYSVEGSPDAPDTPSAPSPITTDPDIDNEEHSSADNEYDIVLLNGFWSTLSSDTVNIGAGTVTSADGTFNLEMNYVSWRFRSLQFDGDDGVMTVSCTGRWFFSRDNTDKDLWLKGNFHFDYSNEEVFVEKIDVNKWSYIVPSSGNKVAITFRSENEVFVEEEGLAVVDEYSEYRGRVYEYSAHYVLRK